MSDSSIYARLLGPPEFRFPSGVILPVTPKLAALIAYVDAQHPEMVPRIQLIDLLWERMFERQARQNVRKSVDRLRRLLGVNVLVSQGDLIGLNPDLYDSDTLTLDRLKPDIAGTVAEDLGNIGISDYLAGVDIGGENWNAWLSAERQRRKDDVVHVLLQAAQTCADENDSQTALLLAERALEANPFAESPRRIKMKILAGMGRSSEAIQGYHQFARFLRRELEVAPSRETQDMLNAISDVPAAVSSGKDWDVGNGPTRTSLAVMPIRVLGESMRGAELAVGLETEIVTTLAKLSDLAIIDLSTLGGQQDGETQGGPADHGAEAVLKCDLQVVGDKLRVTARLIDTTTARQIWADRFDRGLADILEIQDALTKDIVTQLQVRLTEGEQARVWSSGTGDFNAWEAIVRATHLIHAHQKEGIREARHLAEVAVQRDPSFASAYAAIGWTHWVEGRWFWSDDRGSSFEKALDLARRALALDAVNPDARTLHGVVLVHVGQFDQALEEMERAVSLAPSHAHIAALAAYVHHYAGNPNRAIDLIDRAVRLSPGYPSWYLNTKAGALRAIGRMHEAELTLREGHRRDPGFAMPIALLTSLLGQRGRAEEAKAMVKKLLHLEPGFSTEKWCDQSPYRHEEGRIQEKVGLLAAGAPP